MKYAYVRRTAAPSLHMRVRPRREGHRLDEACAVGRAVGCAVDCAVGSAAPSTGPATGFTASEVACEVA